ncbi:MAG: hypothetical protein K0S32_348 [Bacteroidetes bacterium]|jgi:hypothetical protein|nr:hypothetical protein [Bacteroidota bacterium]
MKQVPIVMLFLFLSLSFFSQDVKINENITDKAVIGFPLVTTQQLNDIKAEFEKYPQILQATYVYGTYRCIFIKFDTQGTTFKTFYDFLKPISPFYDVNKCYIKPYDIYDFAEQNIGTTPTFILKP